MQQDNKRDNRRAPIKRDRDRYPDRAAEGIVYGRNEVRELLKSGRAIDKIFVRRGDKEGSINVIIGEASARRIPIIEVEKPKLDSLCGGGVHQGVAAQAAEKEYCSVDDILAIAKERGEMPFIAILDGVEDPYNLGAVIRCAECAGVHGVIIPKRRASGLTATAAKASAGALEHMRVARVTNLAMTLDELKRLGFWIYAADMGGQKYCDVDYSGSVAVVLGSEGFGISRLVKEKCDFTVSIPLYGKVNSMNVSCAAAVILTEVAKGRH
jgi:23S rRNA (guanosine2251-2'-O)-methyltransferase